MSDTTTTPTAEDLDAHLAGMLSQAERLLRHATRWDPSLADVQLRPAGEAADQPDGHVIALDLTAARTATDTGRHTFAWQALLAQAVVALAARAAPPSAPPAQRLRALLHVWGRVGGRQHLTVEQLLARTDIPLARHPGDYLAALSVELVAEQVAPLAAVLRQPAPRGYASLWEAATTGGSRRP